jgi:hypothetical protein
MSKNLTGESLISLFVSKCDEHGRFFVPDPPRQEQVANSLVSHFDNETLAIAVDSFVKRSSGSVLVFDFALVAKDIVERASFEEKSRVRFLEIVENTRKRME